MGKNLRKPQMLASEFWPLFCITEVIQKSTKVDTRKIACMFPLKKSLNTNMRKNK